MANEHQPEPKRPLPFLPLIAASAVLFTLGVLLLRTDSETCWAIGAMFLGGSAITTGYAWWSLLHPKADWKNPSSFIREIGKAFLAVLALLGIAIVLQGIGALAGWEELRFIGSTLAEVFGGS